LRFANKKAAWKTRQPFSFKDSIIVLNQSPETDDGKN